MARYGRGRPAHAFIFNLLATNVPGSDTGHGTDGQALVVHVASADTGHGTDGQALTARPASADTGHADEATGTGAFYAELGDDDARTVAEAATILASMSDGDTRPNATETGPAPPAHVSDGDARTVADANPYVGVASSDPRTAVEGSGTRVTGSDGVNSSELESVDAFGGNAKLGQDSGQLVEGNPTAVVTLSSGDTAHGTDAQPFIGAQDDDGAGIVDANSGNGIRSADTGHGTDAGSVVARFKSTDTGHGVESAPSKISLITLSLSNDAVQIRDNGVTPIGLADDQPATAGDAEGNTRLSGTDTAHVADVGVVRARVSGTDLVTHGETEQSPDVNLPTGVDTIAAAEAATTVVTVSSSDSVALADASELDRGTPPSRVFVVPEEIRLKTIPAVTRVLEIPGEVRVLVISGGFR
ncbi:hypothetical protein [Streptomyces sp. I8-5]|uniref:hypothetical protein n=1 Tax=Streptomyces sp. I8-5 TaxID=3104277 RepID=UPI003869CF9B